MTKFRLLPGDCIVAKATVPSRFRLGITTSAPPKRLQGRVILPINTTSGGLCCTLNTRYDAMQLPEDILSLAHYPKTVLLIEYHL